VKPLISDAEKVASPHSKNLHGEVVLLDRKFEDAIDLVGPAGCIWSNVDDLSKYVLMELRNGKDENGNAIFAEEQILKRRAPGVKVDEDSNYGLGLFIESDKGVKVIHHAGNTLGFTSHMMFFPDNNIGMVILSNASGVNAFRNAMKQRLLEVLLAAEPKSDEMIKFGVKNYKEMIDKGLERVSTKAEDLKWINDFVGHYESRELGPFDIVSDGKGKYQMNNSRWTCDAASLRDPGGKKILGLISPPWTLFEFQAEKDRQTKLIMDAGQVKYELIKSSN